MSERSKIRFLLLLIIIGWHSHDLMAQHASEEKAVQEVIQRLFKGMESGDSSVVHEVFTADATLVSVFRDKQGEPVLRRDESVKPFLKVIGTPHPQPYHEETWNMRIQIDGDLAQVWCDYGLYVGNQFSHCGVDAFHLHKTKTGWKIFHLADTRRTVDCNVPQEIQNKHK
jgi:hypothetical protein